MTRRQQIGRPSRDDDDWHPGMPTNRGPRRRDSLRGHLFTLLEALRFAYAFVWALAVTVAALVWLMHRGFEAISGQ